MPANKVEIKAIVKEFMMSIDPEDFIYGVSEALVRNYALRGIRDMGFDMSKVVKSRYITVSENNLVYLPADFVSLNKVGLVSDEGRIITYAHDGGITHLPSSGLSTVDPDSYHDDFLFRNFVHNGEHGVLYGVGGGYRPGFYKLDLYNNRLLLSSEVNKDKVVIEYLADEALTENPQVHVFAEEALRLYIYYKIIERKSNVPQGEKQRARAEYYNERRKANSRLKSFNKEDALQVVRKNFKLSPKV